MITILGRKLFFSYIVLLLFYLVPAYGEEVPPPPDYSIAPTSITIGNVTPTRTPPPPLGKQPLSSSTNSNNPKGGAAKESSQVVPPVPTSLHFGTKDSGPKSPFMTPSPFGPNAWKTH